MPFVPLNQQKILMKLKEIKANPNNPRVLRDDKFAKLKQSISEFPKMLTLRPMVIDENNMILGGNMRLRALQDLGYTEIDDAWVKRSSDLTEEEKQRFIIADNLSFGSWDWDTLANEWDTEQLMDWGLEVPNYVDDYEDIEEEEKDITEEKEVVWIPDCLYASNNIYEIPTLLIDKQAKDLILPLIPYGVAARSTIGIGTYHFYVDDYRFENLWNNPVKIINSGCKNIVEPNLSLYDTTPISYGLHLIYKKRWLARYYQSEGINVYVDLNVSTKFIDYNILGVPEGYNAFFTRGYKARLIQLQMELEVAKKISQKDNPNFIVYGGGQFIQEFCSKNNCIYVEQMRGFDKTKEFLNTTD